MKQSHILLLNPGSNINVKSHWVEVVQGSSRYAYCIAMHSFPVVESAMSQLKHTGSIQIYNAFSGRKEDQGSLGIRYVSVIRHREQFGYNKPVVLLDVSCGIDHRRKFTGKNGVQCEYYLSKRSNLNAVELCYDLTRRVCLATGAYVHMPAKCKEGRGLKESVKNAPNSIYIRLNSHYLSNKKDLTEIICKAQKQHDIGSAIADWFLEWFFD